MATTSSLLRCTFAVFLSTSLVAEGRSSFGNRRRSAKKSKGRKSGEPKSKKTTDRDKKKTGDDEKRGPRDPKHSVYQKWKNRGVDRLDAKCQKNIPLPPLRIGGIEPHVNDDAAERWTYLKESQRSRPHSRLERVEWTPLRESLCRQIFVGRTPPAKPAAEGSFLTCVLTTAAENAEEQALFLSDYNTKRSLPNFVAFLIPVELDLSNQSSEDVLQDTRHAADNFDAAYTPGSLQPCCWCSNPDQADDACFETVGRVGYLAPLSAFNSSAADVFLNTVPMRRPFAALQWSRRMHELFIQARALHDRMPGRRMHVLIGPSLQADGHLPANVPSPVGAGSRDAEDSIDVPSFLWTAYADPYAHAAAGYMCRNGGVDDDCACARLSLQAIDERLGFRLFPGLASGGQRSEHIHLLHGRPASISRSSPMTQYVLHSVGVLGGLIFIVLVILYLRRDTTRRVKVHLNDRSVRARSSFREKLQRPVRQSDSCSEGLTIHEKFQRAARQRVGRQSLR